MGTAVLHVADEFRDGRQPCMRCGLAIVSTDPHEIGGPTMWPPPFPRGAFVRIVHGHVGPAEYRFEHGDHEYAEWETTWIVAPDDTLCLPLNELLLDTS